MTNLIEQIRDLILDETGLNAHEVDEDSALLTSGLVDSFTFVSILTLIESNNGVRIPQEELTIENFDTIQRIVSLVEKHVIN